MSPGVRRRLPSRAPDKAPPTAPTPPQYADAAASFAGFTFTIGRWDLDWEWLGDGDDGDFKPDGYDRPRLRATLRYDGELVPDGSHHTLATPLTPAAELEASAYALLDQLDSVDNFESLVMKAWTWRSYSV